MPKSTSPVYDSLHFREYLDGGITRLPLPDPQHTRKLLSSGTGFTFADQPDTQHAPPTQTVDSLPPEDRILIENYSHLCQQTLHCSVTGAEFPGGRQRSSFRLYLDNGYTAIASRRFDPGRAQLECQVMQVLGAKHAPIPTCFAFNGLVILQEDLPGIRLSTALKNASETQYTQWLQQALTSLAEIQQLANHAGLQHAVPVVGCEPEWLVALIDRTALLGNYTRLPCPKVPVAQLYERLVLLKPCFIKWDARPGNAMLDTEGRVRWFDWEHCCARNPMDDMAWLLCDDATPEYPDAEAQLIHAHLDAFADGRNPEHAMAYLSVFGTHHACIRICRLLDEKAYDSWQKLEHRLGASPGSLLPITQRLCSKASRWAAKAPETAMLQDWFLDVGEHLGKM